MSYAFALGKMYPNTTEGWNCIGLTLGFGDFFSLPTPGQIEIIIFTDSQMKPRLPLCDLNIISRANTWVCKFGAIHLGAWALVHSHAAWLCKTSAAFFAATITACTSHSQYRSFFQLPFPPLKACFYANDFWSLGGWKNPPLWSVPCLNRQRTQRLFHVAIQCTRLCSVAYLGTIKTLMMSGWGPVTYFSRVINYAGFMVFGASVLQQL